MASIITANHPVRPIIIEPRRGWQLINWRELWESRDLLYFLVMHPNVVLPHDQILQGVWGPDYGDEVEYLRVFINQVRKKIEPDPRFPRYLLTEPSIGYRFIAAASDSGKS